MNSVDATASGMPYPIMGIPGGVPTSLEEFLGETSFTVEKVGAPSEVHGIGQLHDGLVRFSEKAGDGGKDVRTWIIRSAVDGAFTAESASSF